MDVDDDFGSAQPLGQPLVFAQEPLHFLGRGVGLRFRSAGSRRKTLGNACASFLPPLAEMRRVEAFPAQERTDAATAGGGVSLGQNLPFVGSREAAAFGARSHLGVGVAFGAGYTALGLQPGKDRGGCLLVCDREIDVGPQFSGGRGLRIIQVLFPHRHVAHPIRFGFHPALLLHESRDVVVGLR